jgi:hypothetical protein
MCHRIREAMKDVHKGPMSGDGGVVEADETYYGNTSKREKGYRSAINSLTLTTMRCCSVSGGSAMCMDSQAG